MKKDVNSLQTDSWPLNPFITNIRNQGIDIISSCATRYHKLHKEKINLFDLTIQVMLVSCSYSPYEIWLGDKKIIAVITEYITKNALREAEEIMVHGLETKKIFLNLKLIKEITSYQAVRLHRLRQKKHQSISLSPYTAACLSAFPQDAMLTDFKIIKPAQKNGALRGIAIEKQTNKRILIRKINKKISSAYAKGYHYLHAHRSDDTIAFGVFLENEAMPFAIVSYASINRLYKKNIVTTLGFKEENCIELTRAWNSEEAPKNTMSILFAFAHHWMQKHWLNKYNRSLKAILTDINPNLGFKGSAFRAVGFGVVAKKPTAFHYIAKSKIEKEYIIRRELSKLLESTEVHLLKKGITIEYSKFPLLETLELVVILQDKRRITPHPKIQHITRRAYEQEVPFNNTLT